jgi:pyruvate dehydrogenase E1 component beta subunit
MARNPRVFIMGEDVRVFYGGGPFAVTPKERFLDKFGPERIRDTPISESAFIGAGVMAAVAGFHPVTELMFSDFYGVCMDQIANQGAKLRYMFGGQARVPLTIRIAYGGGMSFGATHSQTLYSVFAHMPGIKVVAPSTPYDAKGLLTTALRDENVVAFFEHKALYGTKGDEVPEEQYEIPLGKGDVKLPGKDVTIVAVGKMVHLALQAASQLEEKSISAEVIDPRTLVPLDRETILGSVKHTTRLVIVDEDHSRCGFSAEVAAIAADEAFGMLDAPIKRVTTYNVPLPYAKHLEEAVLPSVRRIVDAVRETVPS